MTTIIQHCPECGNELLTCSYPDYKGGIWYWCESQDCYWHADDLDHAAEHADWLDQVRTIKDLRQGL